MVEKFAPLTSAMSPQKSTRDRDDDWRGKGKKGGKGGKGSQKDLSHITCHCNEVGHFADKCTKEKVVKND